MDFNEYQHKSRKTAGYPVIGHAVIYPTLGLANEAGEVAGKIKKIFRDKEGKIGDFERSALKAELGDVLWYIAQVATELDLSLDEIAEYNIDKLNDRLKRGKIHGNGDDR
ncbi:MAG: nucleoside triphosphate pyrophosphohydrolase family protein [Anaerolineales bacterium]|nr:nucleoside triphosphate pyrophosphohydrolase family protein [Anaerolineales bacterium]